MTSCVIEEVTDAFDPTEFDKHLGDLLIKHEGKTEAFLGTVFNFLKRKTNFFKEGDPKKRVLDAYKQVPGLTDHRAPMLCSEMMLRALPSICALPGLSTGDRGGR